MIIFYNKKTGTIEGKVDGRVHSDAQLKMWHGSRNEVGRIVINWKPIRFYDKDKNIMTKAQIKLSPASVAGADFIPDCKKEQRGIHFNLDKSPQDLNKYKVNLETELLEAIT